MIRRRLGYVVMAACAFTIAEVSHGHTLEAYGDSVTAGFFSHTSAANPPGLLGLLSLSARLAMARSPERRDIFEGLHSPALAWPAVLAESLYGGVDYQLHNVAVSGAQTSNLLGQVENAPASEEPVEALFFIGHNDLCERTDTPEEYGDEFEKHMSAGLKRWDEKHARSDAYLVPVADIHRVYEALAPIGQGEGRGAFTCFNSWERFFPYCPFYARRQRAGTLKEYLEPRIQEANRRLVKIADAWRSEKGNSLRALKDVQSDDYVREYFAADCFHLSEAGQKAIADRIRSSMR